MSCWWAARRSTSNSPTPSAPTPTAATPRWPWRRPRASWPSARAARSPRRQAERAIVSIVVAPVHADFAGALGADAAFDGDVRQDAHLDADLSALRRHPLLDLQIDILADVLAGLHGGAIGGAAGRADA